MRNVTLQDTLAVETWSPEEALKRAIMFDESKQKLSAFQKTKLMKAQITANSGLKIKKNV